MSKDLRYVYYRMVSGYMLKDADDSESSRNDTDLIYIYIYILRALTLHSPHNL
jgi:hypothetical protein